MNPSISRNTPSGQVVLLVHLDMNFLRKMQMNLFSYFPTHSPLLCLTVLLALNCGAFFAGSPSPMEDIIGSKLCPCMGSRQWYMCSAVGATKHICFV